MRYLCLVYFEPERMAALTEEEGRQLTADSVAYDDSLKASGVYIASQALQPVAAATTVRRRRGDVFFTDGPFAETKEHLGGFILIEVENLAEALRVAEGIPMLRMGSIEVRPIMQQVL